MHKKQYFSELFIDLQCRYHYPFLVSVCDLIGQVLGRGSQEPRQQGLVKL